MWVPYNDGGGFNGRLSGDDMWVRSNEGGEFLVMIYEFHLMKGRLSDDDRLSTHHVYLKP